MKITVKGPYIEVGQLLKKMQLITTGGQAKYFLANNVIKINGKIPQGRHSKIADGATIWINDDVFKIEVVA